MSSMRRVARLTMAGLLLASVGCAARGPAPPPPGGRPDLLSRDEWGAAPPVLERMRRHGIRRITIHHTATRQDRDRPLVDKLQALQRFSQNPGRLTSGKEKPAWGDIPYHYYIDVHGRVAETRDVRFAGDTNTTYDTAGHLLIVLEGSFGRERVTGEQWDALRQMVLWAARRWDVRASAIGGHKDYADTACPGDDLYARLPELRRLAGLRTGGTVPPPAPLARRRAGRHRRL